jgi:AmiR/NasT family two-component response regulator
MEDWRDNMDEQTHAKILFKWGLIYKLDIQSSMLREQRDRLEKEIRELENPLDDRAVLENADVLNRKV